MAYSQQVASYQLANANALHKTRQLVMLYDGIIKFLGQAKDAMREKRFEDRYKILQKASNIIIGLHGALDMEKGGEIAQMLNSFYAAMDLRIINLNRSNSPEECDKVISEINMMRSAWNKIDQEYSPQMTLKPEEVVVKPVDTSGADFNA